MTSEVNQHQPPATVSLSPAALSHVQKQIAKRGKGIGMRLSLKKTGCSGLSYVVDIIDEVAPTDKVFPVNSDVVVAVSRQDLPYLLGTEIDYVKQGLNQQFQYRNPNATGACGCGESFAVDS